MSFPLDEKKASKLKCYMLSASFWLSKLKLLRILQKPIANKKVTFSAECTVGMGWGLTLLKDYCKMAIRCEL